MNVFDTQHECVFLSCTRPGRAIIEKAIFFIVLRYVLQINIFYLGYIIDFFFRNFEFVFDTVFDFHTQYSTECFCGNSFGQFGRRPEVECNHQCTANKSQICGGVNRNSVLSGRTAYWFIRSVTGGFIEVREWLCEVPYI